MTAIADTAQRRPLLSGTKNLDSFNFINKVEVFTINF